MKIESDENYENMTIDQEQVNETNDCQSRLLQTVSHKYYYLDVEM